MPVPLPNVLNITCTPYLVGVSPYAPSGSQPPPPPDNYCTVPFLACAADITNPGLVTSEAQAISNYA